MGGGLNLEEELRRCSVDSMELSGNPPSKTLLVKMANDYSQYFKTDLSFQVAKVEEFVEESLAKLEELRSLFDLKEHEVRVLSSQVLPDLVRTGTLLTITLNQRLDTLSALLLSLNSSLDVLEGQINMTEAKLGYGGSSSTTTAIKSVFTKYFQYKTEDSSSGTVADTSKSKKSTTLSSSLSYQQLKESSDPLQLSQFFHEQIK